MPCRFWFLAWVAEQAVGVAALVAPPSSSAEERERQLDALWVVPGWRGRGVGEALISAAVDHAAGHGARSVSLTVAENNRPALGLYHRMGFHRTGERSPRLRDPGKMRERLLLSLVSEDCRHAQTDRAGRPVEPQGCSTRPSCT
ncbi:GNAT family N-acetyltransferase [Streptomyces flaveolus]|uniref:GNAT family N-acetyltransferase n=1 Tax=Streptomyces flaveolus TaxID=67297 RepID=UPI0033AA5E2F